MGPVKVFSAPLVLVGPEEAIRDGGLLVGAGKVQRLLRSVAEVRRARRRFGPGVDLEEAVLAPGFVNAHSHLELSDLHGRLRGTDGFLPWVRALVAERARRERALLARGALAGAQRMLSCGTTSVGDIDATGVALESSGAPPVRLRLYREVLDAWDPTRTAAALERVRRRLPRRSLRSEGLAPHAPHTTSAELLAGLRALRRKRPVPVTVHWAETEEEGDWLERGVGPWSRLLPRSPLKPGLALLEEAGLLGPTTSLVHGNHPARGEPETLARHGVVLVHCPGSHAFFGRGAFPWRRYRHAGVALALGTDSLASNADLDLRREMRLAREAAPWLSPAEVFAMATHEAARAIALAGVGRLTPGSAADVVAHRVARASARAAVEELTAGRGEVLGVWIAGRRRWRVES